MPIAGHKASSNANPSGSSSNGFGRDVLEFIEKVEALSLFQDRIAKPFRLPQVWNAFRSEVERLITPNAMALYLVDPQTNAFELSQWSPEDSAPVCRSEIEAQIECGTFAWIVNRRRPAVIPSFVFKGAHNLVMLPLTTHARTLGVAMIVTTIEDDSVTHERLRLLGILSKQFALVMENTLLYDHLREEHQALQAAQTQIIQAEKFASIGRLTSGAFHELLNPLNIISGHLQLMMLTDEVPSPSREYLTVMKSAADRIAGIVNSLLRFSVKHPKNNRRIDVAKLLREVVNQRMSDGSTDRIRVQFDIDQELPLVWTSADDLHTVLGHLVDNACDAMPEGGRMTIGARSLAADHDKTEEVPCLEVVVADTGAGIADSDTHKVFDPFFTTKAVGQGTGLSLAVSYALVCSMGGSLAFKADRKQGTIFTIRLPLGEAPPKTTH